jgi:ComF family protein
MPGGGSTCGECLCRTSVPAVERCVAAVDYRYPWDGLIARFKFRQEPGWASTLAEPMWQQAQALALMTPESLWVPIPVSPGRLAERGYNQAWELCRALRRRSGLPALAEALVRITEAPDQHRLAPAQRLSNLKGAFAVHPAHVSSLRDAEIVLVDDVRTTGSTLENAALALRQAGCARVHALVFARTPNDSDQSHGA